ncbi:MULTISPECIES: helicase-related protein [Paraburkholderia]|uniref:Helicase-related protein n=1 Tax=Paraburkholderia madseniana TaxID=2599607 RepID=A0AAP5BL35_9BURK|nr:MULTISPECIES: helicase-related protein [Paraburkholderia]MCX4151758.1 helicase-related protein [Paraburkholderia madseniana]MDN7154685.1 SNF2-related protein [Paraburkholderia sp. WS6]MDQ6413568.1 SNF2-related protein [Paraburkholderia madseniana]
MLKLEAVTKNTLLTGIEPDQIARVMSVEPAGEDAIAIVYKTGDGRLGERMILRDEEASIALAEVGRPWGFDASGEDFKLAAEAYRISLAHLFDRMMAVHTSNVDPLPHQITAVYESMLPRQPLRYVLADDPGAGKTIMAGLLIRELLMRADVRKVLIVAPGSLVEQWQAEMDTKFGLSFSIFSREMEQASRGPNPFEEAELLIARLDMLARSDDLQEKLSFSRWDLVIVDEAHKLSATWYGTKINETRRFKLGKLLGEISRHFLLMTATPHNGKEEDFQLFLSLLDSDRFFGKFRDGAHKVDVSDLMRRMVKEDLLKFDGSRLFPERFAYTVNYKLSQSEAALYADVTDYVKEQMNRADELADGARKGTVGFALTALQRRLASSPAAIYHSLKRRREKLQHRVEDERAAQRGQAPRTIKALVVAGDVWEREDDLDPEAFEDFEEEVVDQATAAQTIQELEEEIRTLLALEEQARELAHSERDRKWEELSNILQNRPEMRTADGRRRKLIIFTEHRDTLNYLCTKIRGLLGSDEAVVQIHGGVPREGRLVVQELFRHDVETVVLLATDAAGEGVNLQNANLMVNYDLPWNPNRLEQRFGRIHRIGQTEVCHLWNMVASETREGDVFQRLLAKLEVEKKALGGRVFDILGEVFDERSLRDLLIQAIRYGEDPSVRAKLHMKVEGALDTEHLLDIMKRNALAEEIIDHQRLFAVKEEMEKAEARKLQPYFIRSFFSKAFQQYGGELKVRELARAQITFVPAVIRERGRQLATRQNRNADPVLNRYERVCFEREAVRPEGQPGLQMASLIHSGHPLMQALVDLTLDDRRGVLKQGAVFVDPNDLGIKAKVLFIIDHSIKEAGPGEQVASRRMQFVSIDEDGVTKNEGWAPHLNWEPITTSDRVLIGPELNAPWIRSDLENLALTHASEHLVPEHFIEVKERRERQVDKTLAAVHERLLKEITYQSDRYRKLRDDLAAGKDTRLAIDNTRRIVDDLTVRRETREKELRAMRQVVSATPVIVGGALVIPSGLLAQRNGDEEGDTWSADPVARARVEQLAMQAVFEHEHAHGRSTKDVSALKCGWDITSQPPMVNGLLPDPRHIEVKGRAKGSETVTVTVGEIIEALNQGPKFILAIVMVDGDRADPPLYIRQPFAQPPEWGTTSVNFSLKQLMTKLSSEAL